MNNNTLQIELTDIQVDFIKKATEMGGQAVLDFTLNDETWNECYPYTKKQMTKAINDLKNKLQ